MFDVLNIGILVADVIARPVDRIPERGKLGLCDKISLHTGGNAMSCSIDIAKLGGRSAIIGKVGGDMFGEYLMSELHKYGVDTRGIVRDPAVATSTTIALTDSGGERTFIHCAESNDAFGETDIDYDVVAASNIVFVGGTYLLKRFDGEQTAVALQKAKTMGKITALDPCWDDTGRWMEVLAPCLPHLDYFLPSQAEAEMLSGTTDVFGMSQCFLERGVKRVVIKLGADGCFFRNGLDDKGTYLPTFPGGAVDTTGAGDAFCAGALYALSQGATLAEACRHGNAVGTACVSGVGATAGVNRDAVERILNGQQ